MPDWWLLFAAFLLTWGPVAPQPAQSQDPRKLQEVVEDALARELIVVTASRREEQLLNAPATMTVITDEDIAIAPSRSMADLMRVVPGINVSQTSARDLNITSRGATGTLADSTLVLLDGRSIYQDFFGFVMWDFIPIEPHEIKQIEIIRGPASAVWGANAMTGVVNVITKPPRELAGTAVSVQFGHFDRTRRGEPFDGGGLFAISATHAAAPADHFAYKLSGSLYAQESFLRPSGSVPGTTTAYPSFENRGTTQPKLDARADYDVDGDCSGEFPQRCRKLILAGGIAGTEGIMHTGLGPLDIYRGSTLKYGRIVYQQDQLRVQLFVNALDGEGRFLLQRGSSGGPMDATFENQSYDVELANLTVMGTRHLLSYGGNFRINRFGLSLAPRATGRTEGGVYGQYELFSHRIRWIAGTRVDRFGVVDTTVISPRTTLILKPFPRHQVRGSYNRAFRVPSIVNSLIDTVFLAEVQLGEEGGAFRFPSRAEGNPDIREEALTAYELAYTASHGPVTATVALYLNRTRNMILFSQIDSYTGTNPPPGWPFPPAALDRLVSEGRGLPSRYSYINFDRISERGIEVSFDGRVNQRISSFINYTWQPDPVARGLPLSELNMPPNHRINAGAAYQRSRYAGSASVSYQDSAFWQDELDARYHGWTASYALINAMASVRSRDGSMVAAMRASNVLNRRTQQHIFGDVIRRTVTGEIRLQF